jgi:peptidoglycan/LPS O-acetylase OafA/YrhL
MSRSDAPALRLAGLDSLRLAAAAWVACSHGARPPFERVFAGGDAVSRALVAFDNGLFNGVAAVMLFFVISGLVIHYANVGLAAIDVPGHYTRRLLRVAPPLVVMQAICLAMGPQFQGELNEVLWSVYFEMAFYVAYPLLFPLLRAHGAARVAWMACLPAAVGIAATWPLAYHSMLPFPALLAIGAPCILLGCVLADKLANKGLDADPGARIWAWRLAAIVLSAAMKAPVTHGPLHIGYPASHWLFALFSYFWLAREIACFARHAPPRWMEKGGAMSYSLYLAHFPVLGLFLVSETANAPLRGALGAGAGAWMAAWVLQIAAIAMATLVFHTFVEAPSHRLARALGRRASAAGAKFAWGRPATA